MPKVSIIMCAYNVQAYIDRAIQSIQNQTYTDWELIISDDKSTDNTVAIIERYLSDKRIKLYKQENNLGYIRNKNFAFQQAAGELLTQLDADDACPPDRIARQVKIFEDSSIEICGTNYMLVNPDDKMLSEPRKYNTDFLVYKIEGEYPFWFPSLMFKKHIVDDFGLFSEYFTGIVGDDEYWTYRVNSRYPIYFIKDPLYHYRIHSTSLTNTYDKPRKMIVAEILREIQRQRNETGTDLLEKGLYDEMKKFEDVVLSNNGIMAEKYRTWAAKAIDNKELKVAGKLLRKSLSAGGVNSGWLRTALYYTKTRLRG